MAEVIVVPELQAKVDQAQQRSALYWVLAITALVILAEQSTFGFLLYSPILGQLAVTFHTSQVEWVYTALLLAGAVSIPLLTKLGDVFGKRRIVFLGVVITCVGCLLCVVAPNFGVLIAGRVLMSAGTAFSPLSVALMREVFPVRFRAVAIAVAVNGTGVVAILGPLLSGWLVRVWNVRAPFAFQLVLCVVAGCLVLVVPESPMRLRAKVDYLGASILGLGAFGVMFGLSQEQTHGWNSFTISTTIAGAVVLVGWWFQLRHSREPLINFKLLQRRASLMPVVTTASLVGAFALVNLFLTLMWSTPHAIEPYGHGLSPLAIAVWTIPAGVLGVASGVVVGLTVRSVGYRFYVILGSLCYIFVSVFFAFNLNAPTAVMIIVTGVAGLGGMSAAALVSLLIVAVPADQRSVAIGVSQSFNSIAGAATQVAAFAILGTGVGVVVEGVSFYSETAYRTAFLAVAGLAVLGLIFAFMIPHGRRQARAERPAQVTEAAASS